MRESFNPSPVCRCTILYYTFTEITTNEIFIHLELLKLVNNRPVEIGMIGSLRSHLTKTEILQACQNTVNWQKSCQSIAT